MFKIYRHNKNFRVLNGHLTLIVNSQRRFFYHFSHKRFLASLQVELLKNSLLRTRVKVSQALESMVQHVETYAEYDPLIVNTQPSNPWVSEDITYWQLNSPL